MSRDARFPAVFVYLVPVIGWLYVFFTQRSNVLAVYHLRQSIGLFLFLLAAIVIWAISTWILAWIPYLILLGIALFTLVIVAYLYGAVAWILGMIRAARNELTPLPIFGQWAERLPIR